MFKKGVAPVLHKFFQNIEGNQFLTHPMKVVLSWYLNQTEILQENYRSMSHKYLWKYPQQNISKSITETGIKDYTPWPSGIYPRGKKFGLCSVQLFSRVWLFATSWTAACQASLSITNSWSLLKLCPLSQLCHSTISSSVIAFSSCLQSFPASGSFQMRQLFASGGQSMGVSVSTSVLPMSIQDWFPLGWTGWISLQSKGLSRVFSNITVQKHQFFGAQLSLWCDSHIHTWPLEKP